MTGVISKTSVTPGNLVIADKTLLTVLVSVDPIYVSFDVDERTLLEVQVEIRKGGFKNAKDAKIPVWAGLATEKGGYPHEGFLDFVDNRINTSTGTLKFRATLPNPGVLGSRLFTPGLFVRVKVDVTTPANQLLVADRAIGSDLDKKYVYVVNEKKAVERRPIKLGPLYKGLRVVYPVQVVFTDKGVR